MPEKYWVISRKKVSSEKIHSIHNPSYLFNAAIAAKNEQLGILLYKSIYIPVHHLTLL